jgi:aspartyl-tRNA(Asn)/glutamyl-tRNA(Gln) amidotransferase subunit A
LNERSKEPLPAKDCSSTIARLNPGLNAFVTLAANAAGAGMPIGIKANIAVAGLPHHAGIAAYRNIIAARDAACVARLRTAGAIILGLLNMDEAAFGGTTDNPHFGRTINPRRAGFTAGGSSGGAGAAAASGMCVAALGTDTLGSVRIPASYCGVIGHVPAPGLIPVDGVIPLVPQWDRVGILARDVDTIETVLAQMTAEHVPRNIPMPGPIGVLDIAGLDIAPAVAAALARTAEAAARAGLRVEPFAWPGHDYQAVRHAALLLLELEASRIHAAALASNPEGFSPHLRQLLAWAAAQPAQRRETAHARLAATRAAFLRAIVPYQAVLMPTTPQPAFAFGPPPPKNQADFTMLANIAGLAATAFPAGLDDDGLPVSVQAIAASDAVCLALARRVTCCP